jgi:glucose uptake protein GlcU
VVAQELHHQFRDQLLIMLVAVVVELLPWQMAVLAVAEVVRGQAQRQNLGLSTQAVVVAVAVFRVMGGHNQEPLVVVVS